MPEEKYLISLDINNLYDFAGLTKRQEKLFIYHLFKLHNLLVTQPLKDAFKKSLYDHETDEKFLHHILSMIQYQYYGPQSNNYFDILRLHLKDILLTVAFEDKKNEDLHIDKTHLANIYREIVGNPYKPKLDINCISINVLELARTIYTIQDFELTPILADALEEAKCSDRYILGHLRNKRVCLVCMGEGKVKKTVRRLGVLYKTERKLVDCPGKCDKGWLNMTCDHVIGCYVLEQILRI